MNEIVVIATTPKREAWLTDCLESMPNTKVMVLSDFTYELGKIRWLRDNTTLDRFLFLQDSVVIKDEAVIAAAFEQEGSVCFSTDPFMFGMYLGIYDMEVLRQIDIPIVTSKRQSIDYEISWHKTYCDMAGKVTIMFDDIKDSMATGVVMRHGRENLLLENQYLAKYKGDWGQRWVTW